MRKKKDIPLVVLETIEPFIKAKDEHFNVLRPDKYLLHIVDSDSESDFFFKVIDYQFTNGKTYLNIEFKPHNKNTTSSVKTRIEYNSLSGQFKNWLQRLKEYEKVSLYDDPILKKNEERFLNQFKILDEDADYASFDLTQQLFLDEYLEASKSRLLQLKEGKDEDEVAEIEVLESDIETIKKELTKASKKEIIERLSRFWAKAQKTGIEIIKEVFISFATELTKKLITGQ